MDLKTGQSQPVPARRYSDRGYSGGDYISNDHVDDYEELSQVHRRPHQ